MSKPPPKLKRTARKSMRPILDPRIIESLTPDELLKEASVVNFQEAAYRQHYKKKPSLTVTANQSPVKSSKDAAKYVNQSPCQKKIAASPARKIIANSQSPLRKDVFQLSEQTPRGKLHPAVSSLRRTPGKSKEMISVQKADQPVEFRNSFQRYNEERNANSKEENKPAPAKFLQCIGNGPFLNKNKPMGSPMYGSNVAKSCLPVAVSEVKPQKVSPVKKKPPTPKPRKRSRKSFPEGPECSETKKTKIIHYEKMQGVGQEFVTKDKENNDAETEGPNTSVCDIFQKSPAKKENNPKYISASQANDNEKLQTGAKLSVRHENLDHEIKKDEVKKPQSEGVMSSKNSVASLASQVSFVRTSTPAFITDEAASEGLRQIGASLSIIRSITPVTSPPQEKEVGKKETDIPPEIPIVKFATLDKTTKIKAVRERHKRSLSESDIAADNQSLNPVSHLKMLRKSIKTKSVKGTPKKIASKINAVEITETVDDKINAKTDMEKTDGSQSKIGVLSRRASDVVSTVTSGVGKSSKRRSVDSMWQAVLQENEQRKFPRTLSPPKTKPIKSNVLLYDNLRNQAEVVDRPIQFQSSYFKKQKEDKLICKEVQEAKFPAKAAPGASAFTVSTNDGGHRITKVSTTSLTVNPSKDEEMSPLIPVTTATKNDATYEVYSADTHYNTVIEKDQSTKMNDSESDICISYHHSHLEPELQFDDHTHVVEPQPTLVPQAALNTADYVQDSNESDNEIADASQQLILKFRRNNDNYPMALSYFEGLSQKQESVNINQGITTMNKDHQLQQDIVLRKLKVVVPKLSPQDIKKYCSKGSNETTGPLHGSPETPNQTLTELTGNMSENQPCKSQIYHGCLHKDTVLNIPLIAIAIGNKVISHQSIVKISTKEIKFEIQGTFISIPSSMIYQVQSHLCDDVAVLFVHLLPQKIHPLKALFSQVSSEQWTMSFLLSTISADIVLNILQICHHIYKQNTTQQPKENFLPYLQLTEKESRRLMAASLLSLNKPSCADISLVVDDSALPSVAKVMAMFEKQVAPSKPLSEGKRRISDNGEKCTVLKASDNVIEPLLKCGDSNKKDVEVSGSISVDCSSKTHTLEGIKNETANTDDSGVLSNNSSGERITPSITHSYSIKTSDETDNTQLNQEVINKERAVSEKGKCMDDTSAMHSGIISKLVVGAKDSLGYLVQESVSRIQEKNKSSVRLSDSPAQNKDKKHIYTPSNKHNDKCDTNDHDNVKSESITTNMKWLKREQLMETNENEDSGKNEMIVENEGLSCQIFRSSVISNVSPVKDERKHKGGNILPISESTVDACRSVSCSSVFDIDPPKSTSFKTPIAMGKHKTWSQSDTSPIRDQANKKHSNNQFIECNKKQSSGKYIKPLMSYENKTESDSKCIKLKQCCNVSSSKKIPQVVIVKSIHPQKFATVRSYSEMSSDNNTCLMTCYKSTSNVDSDNIKIKVRKMSLPLGYRSQTECTNIPSCLPTGHFLVLLPSIGFASAHNLPWTRITTEDALSTIQVEPYADSYKQPEFADLCLISRGKNPKYGKWHSNRSLSSTSAKSILKSRQNLVMQLTKAANTYVSSLQQVEKNKQLLQSNLPAEERQKASAKVDELMQQAQKMMGEYCDLHEQFVQVERNQNSGIKHEQQELVMEDVPVYKRDFTIESLEPVEIEDTELKKESESNNVLDIKEVGRMFLEGQKLQTEAIQKLQTSLLESQGMLHNLHTELEKVKAKRQETLDFMKKIEKQAS